MASMDVEDDLLSYVGEMLVVGFSGTTVTPEITELIEQYHVGSVLLSKKNIIDAQQAATLIRDLQCIARDSGHEHPLMITVDHEGGFLNFTETQYPGAMSLAATSSPQVARDVSSAAARELRALGVNWILGPVLDVNSDQRNGGSGGGIIGSRSFGDSAEIVGEFGAACIQGYHNSEMATCVKYFPGYGSVDGAAGGDHRTLCTSSDLPPSSIDPYRQAILEGVDSVMVASGTYPAVTGNDLPAFTSPRLIRNLLREDLGFTGLILCECIEQGPTAFTGLGNIAIRAISAGCDALIVCCDFEKQKEGIEAIVEAVAEGVLGVERVRESVRRMRGIKERFTIWEDAVREVDIGRMEVRAGFGVLARRAYEGSVTVVRDQGGALQRLRQLASGVPIMPITIVSPIVIPLSSPRSHSEDFRTFGQAMSRFYSKVRHIPYNAHGLGQAHETLIQGSAATIVLVSNIERNPCQAMITKYIRLLAGDKPVVVVSVATPYDFAFDASIGTLVCIYDYSHTGQEVLADALFGKVVPKGVVPITALRNDHGGQVTSPRPQSSRVEDWSKNDDTVTLVELWKECFRSPGMQMDAPTLLSILDRPAPLARHFVVRNSATRTMTGFIATFLTNVRQADGASCLMGSIGVILVHPKHRNRGIGGALLQHAVLHLRANADKRFGLQFGSTFPRLLPGIPCDLDIRDQDWVRRRGWNIEEEEIHDMHMSLDTWSASTDYIKQAGDAGVIYQTCRAKQYAQLTEFVRKEFSHLPGWVHAYETLALTDDITDAVIGVDLNGDIVCSVIVYSMLGSNLLVSDLRWPMSMDERVGGMTCLGTTKEHQASSVGLGLVQAAVGELRKRDLTNCYVDWTRCPRWFEKVGFTIWRTYREAWTIVE
ncbi:hypothetical protein YB2330_001074 [Saitoella coloradoensis]